jgi:hypothetical protein
MLSIILSVLGVKKKSLVQKAQGKASSATNMFKKAINNLDKANELLKESIEKDTEMVIAIEKNREEAIDNLNTNEKLKNKLSDFLS